VLRLNEGVRAALDGVADYGLMPWPRRAGGPALLSGFS
jgi:hypothetical protein